MARTKSSPTKAATRDLTTNAWFSPKEGPAKFQALGSQDVKVRASAAMDVESIYGTNADGREPSKPHRLRQKTPAIKTVKKINASSPVKTPNGGKEGPSNGISNHTQAGPNGIPAKNQEDGPTVASLFKDTEPPASVTDETEAPSPAKVSAWSNGAYRESDHSVVDASAQAISLAQVSAESNGVHRDSDQAGVASAPVENVPPGATEVSSEITGDQDVASVTDETNSLAAASTNNRDQGVANVAEAVKSPAMAKSSTESNGDQDVARLAEINKSPAVAGVSSTSNGESAQGPRAPPKRRYYLSSDSEDDDHGLINSPSEPSDDDDDDSDDHSEKTLAMAVADSTETAIRIDSDDETLAGNDNDAGERDNKPVECDNEPAEPETPMSMMEFSDQETPSKRAPRRKGRPPGLLSSTGSSQAAKSNKAKRKSRSKPKKVIETPEERDSYFEPGYLVYGPWPGNKPDAERKSPLFFVFHVSDFQLM
jgi:hypothetical protein